MRFALVALALAAAACTRDEAPRVEPFLVFVKVESEPGRPVGGATLSHKQHKVATTGADGRALLRFSGFDGEVVPLDVRCPDELQSPDVPTGVRLVRLPGTSDVPEYSVSCPTKLRRVVVAIRAENGPNLPVLYRGQPITRTDTSGAAHFALEVATGARFDVALDTQEVPSLRPVSPKKPFVVGPHDDVLVFEQRFVDERKKERDTGPRGAPRRAID